MAAKSRNWELVKELYKLGACLDSASRSGVRALHYACMSENKDAVRFLLDHGADIHTRTTDGKTEKDLTSSKEVLNSHSLYIIIYLNSLNFCSNSNFALNFFAHTPISRTFIFRAPL